MELVGHSSSKKSSALKLLRCMEWLQKQNTDVSQKQSVSDNKNDLKYIIQTNADREKFLLSVGGDEATVPVGAGEPSIKPMKVPLHRLRLDNLRMECEWQSCKCFTSNYEVFQEHIKTHISDVHVIETKHGVEYACLWDVCGHKTSDYNELIRHVNYHAYHARLLAIGFNGRATLKLARCKKSSKKRNHLPHLPSDHCCMWTGCEEKFNSIQMFLDHVNYHIGGSRKHLCSWAGCGSMFPRRNYLLNHLRSHTGERLIACYHCGTHFANNRKLCDHLRRQNVPRDSPYSCTMCGAACATEYLLNEHARQHVSACVCALCDMSAATPATLASHVRYRHLAPSSTRVHACTDCTYRAVTKCDLRKHMLTHTRKRKLDNSDEESEGNDSRRSGSGSEGGGTRKKKKVDKKYACHLCPEKQMKVFSRGARLTKHLVKEHGAQWPFGHSRFRYQISEDGMYRLTTTRYEVLEVSEKIVDGHSGPKEFRDSNSEFELKQIAEPTERTPRRFAITFRNDTSDAAAEEPQPEEKHPVEITICDVDELGNVIKSEIMYS